MVIGALVDVSASMKSEYTLKRSRDANVQCTHAILTAIRNFASAVFQKVIPHVAQECIFVGAFGLSGHTETCDLISLLEIAGKDGHQALTDLVKEHGAPQTEPWIRKHLSHFEAQILYQRLYSDKSLLSKLIELLPPQETKDIVASGVDTVNRASEAAVLHWSDASKFAHGIIKLDLKRLEQPTPRPIQNVSKMLIDLLESKVEDAPSSTSHDQIEEWILAIRPYIFGDTPMCKALNDTGAVFGKMNANSKVLFILSKGSSMDGDPRPIAQKLRELGVIIVTLFITSDHIDDPRRFFDKADPHWDAGKSVLFEMSSIIRNTDPPICYLIDTKWKLPPSGATHLFLQANTSDMINEFCKLVVSNIPETNY